MKFKDFKNLPIGCWIPIILILIIIIIAVVNIGLKTSLILLGIGIVSLVISYITRAR